MGFKTPASRKIARGKRLVMGSGIVSEIHQAAHHAVTPAVQAADQELPVAETP
jgi:hypothetical protein